MGCGICARSGGVAWARLPAAFTESSRTIQRGGNGRRATADVAGSLREIKILAAQISSAKQNSTAVSEASCRIFSAACCDTPDITQVVASLTESMRAIIATQK